MRNPDYVLLGWSNTGVGAILRRFLSPPASAAGTASFGSSETSLLLRFCGARPSEGFAIEAAGVCGGVVNGTPLAPAVTLGTAPIVGVGLFIAAGEVIALTDDATDEDRAGDSGKRVMMGGAGDGGSGLCDTLLEEGVEVG